MELKIKGLQRIGRKKPAKTKAPKAPKALSGARFVLFVGDEGAILIYMKGKAVLSRQFVPDASEQNLADLKSRLLEEPKAPVLVVLDTMDQSYIQQTLPPVSAMSVKKLIKRRLDRDFGENDIKGAVILGRETTGRKDWNFLMVAVEKTRQLSLWIDFVSDLPNRFLGICLASVETENILKNLKPAADVFKDAPGAQWKFFVSHNKVGGFRQVILKNGRIIFTRLAQPVGESTPEVIAGNIEQEMLNTIEYMKRLSYDKAAGLDIVIIASEGIKTLFDRSRFDAESLQILTPFELAQQLQIEGATQPTDQFGDVVLAASISCSRKHILTLQTPESKKFDALYKIFYAQRMAALVASLLLVVYAGSTLYDIVKEYNNTSELEDSKKRYQSNLTSLQDEIKNSHIDVEKAGDLMDLYQLLQKQKVSPLAFIAQVETVLKPPMKIKSISWSIDDKSTKNAAEGEFKAVAVFTLTLSNISNAEAFKVASKKILADLKETFKNFDASFTKIPPQFLENEKLDMTFSSSGPAARTNENIEGEVQLTMKEL